MGGEYVLFKKIDGGTTLGHFAYAGREGGKDELCTMIGGFVGVPLDHKFFIMSLRLIIKNLLVKYRRYTKHV